MKSSYQNLNPKAFTLLELSITIITIAILLSAILSARSLKSNLEQKAFYTEIVQIREKINNFKLIYDYLPGDFPNAGKLFNSTLPTCTDELIDSGYGTSDRSGCNGDGDNNWDKYLISCCYGEGYMVWLHLQLAALISSPRSGDEYYNGYSNIGNPQSDNNNLYQSKTYIDILLLPTETWFEAMSHPSTRYPKLLAMPVSTEYELTTNKGVFTPLEMQQIDLKFDDGWPKLGNIEGYRFWSDTSTTQTYCLTAEESMTSATDFTQVTYDITNNEKSCIAHFLIKD